jgi:cysteinyl-tRNA synthetase
VKMSKSLNNFFTIKDVLAKHSVEVIRYFMLSSHYRSPVNYSEENMARAHQALTKLYTAMRGTNCDLNVEMQFDASSFLAAMNDDFNSPLAFSVFFEMAKDINILREANKINEASVLATQLKKLGEIFGILQSDPELFLQGDVSDDFSKQVESLIAARAAAKKNKDYAEADRLRHELQQLNVVIEDGAGGTTWRKV